MRRHQAQWAMLALVLAFAAAVALSGQAKKDDVEWGNDAKKPAGDVEWGAGGLNIPVARNAEITFAPTTAPAVVVGNDVFSLKDGTKLATFPGESDRNSQRLSADGKFFATMLKGDKATVVVYDATTGGRATEIVPGGKDKLVDFLAFAGPKLLVVASRDGNKSLVETWDPTLGKRIRSFPATDRVEKQKAAITPDGKYMAIIGHQQVSVINLTSGAAVATMKAPPSKKAAAAAPPAGAQPPAPPRPVRPAAAADPEAVFLYAWARGVCFSPDARELAAIFEQDGYRLVVWDTKGNITLDTKPRMKRISDDRQPIVWLPDNSGWLLYARNIFDRKLQRVVWQYPALWHETVAARFLGKKETLLLSAGEKSLGTVAIPWDQIAKSAAAMNGKDAHPLRPGGAIALQLTLADLQFGGDKAETEKAIKDALAKRLDADNIKLQDGAPVVLKLDYAEKAGEHVKVMNMRNQFDFHGVDSGKTVQNTTASMKVQLLANGQSVFDDTLTSGGLGRTFKEEITEAMIRKVALENMTNQLPELPIPYFIPSNAELEPLPLVAR